MKLHFLSFDVETGHDIVYVYDGNNASAPLIHMFSDASRLHDVFSSGNAMFVLFVTDESKTKDGFKIAYSTINTGKAQSFLGKLIDPKERKLTLLQVLPFTRSIE